MIRITLIRKINGKGLIKLFKEKYGSLESLEKVFKEKKGNMKMKLDLDDWKYFLKNPDEKVEDSETIFVENMNINLIELGLLDIIKNEKPKSISELAKITNKDVSFVHRKIKDLEKEGFVTLERGNKNSAIPSVNFDKIEIAI